MLRCSSESFQTKESSKNHRSPFEKKANHKIMTARLESASSKAFCLDRLNWVDNCEIWWTWSAGSSARWASLFPASFKPPLASQELLFIEWLLINSDKTVCVRVFVWWLMRALSIETVDFWDSSSEVQNRTDEETSFWSQQTFCSVHPVGSANSQRRDFEF